MTVEMVREVVTSDQFRFVAWTRPRIALDSVLHCSQRVLGSAAWWSCMAQRLDNLREEMSACDVEGLAAQISADAPHLAAAARRLAPMNAAILDRARDLRLRIAEVAGSATAAPAIADEMTQFLHSVTVLYRTSDRLLVEAYERDLGGE